MLREKTGLPIVVDVKALEERSKPPAAKEKDAPKTHPKKSKDVSLLTRR